MLLSLDVSFRNMGWAVFDKGEVVACGVITTEAKSKKSRVRTADDTAMKAAQIAAELREVVTAYEVKGVVGELPSGGAKSAAAMKLMGMATATTAACLELLGLPAEWVTPNDVKMAACGNRSASKEEVMDACRKRFAHHGFPKAKSAFEHIADACFAYVAASKGGNLVKLFG